MRILVITNLYPPYYLGGYELRCRVVVEGLRLRGHQVKVLTSDYRARQATEDVLRDASDVYRSLKFYWFKRVNVWDVYRAELQNHACLRSLTREFEPELFYVWNFGGLGLSLLSHLQSYGMPLVFHFEDDWFLNEFERDYWLNYCRDEHPLNILRTAWTLSRTNPSKFSVPESVSPSPSASQQTMFAEHPPLSPRRTSFTRALYHRLLRGLSSSFSRRFFSSMMVRYLPIDAEPIDLRHAAFISCFRQQQYLQAGLDVAETRVIYGGIDTRQFRISEPRDSSDARFRILCVAQLYEGKGLHTAIDALAILVCKGYTQASLSISGTESDGETYTEFLRKKVRDSEGLRNRVHFLGGIAYKDMPSVYQTHDCFVSASIIPEGFPLTLVEAMASGLPVLTTATGGAREIVTDGHDGLVFSPGSPESLARELERLLMSPDLRNSLSYNAEQKARRRFDSQAMLDTIEQHLSDCRQQEL